MVRLVVSITLACVALGLFLMSRTSVGRPDRPSGSGLTPALVSSIDHDVDTLLAQFRIERAWIRKKVVTVPNSTVSRIERTVAIPGDVLPLQVNLAMNSMAKRYNGRAIASENLKENSVTIHIEMQGYVVQTIILKTNRDLRRSAEKKAETKV